MCDGQGVWSRDEPFPGEQQILDKLQVSLSLLNPNIPTREKPGSCVTDGNGRKGGMDGGVDGWREAISIPALTDDALIY